MGIIVGGIILGIAETTTGFYLSTGYKDVPGLVLLLLVLAVQAGRPVRQDGDQEGMSATVRRRRAGLVVASRPALRSAASRSARASRCSRSCCRTPYYIHLAETIMIYAILLFGLDIVVGYTGQVSLGHAGLFGIGAYTAGVLRHCMLGLDIGAFGCRSPRRRDRGHGGCSARCSRCRRCA